LTRSAHPLQFNHLPSLRQSVGNIVHDGRSRVGLHPDPIFSVLIFNPVNYFVHLDQREFML